MRISDWSSDVCSSDLALSPLMRSPAPDASRTAQPVVATVPVAPAPTAVDVELRAIDRALQAGYARNATDDELKALWAQRQRLRSEERRVETEGVSTCSSRWRSSP